MRPDIERWDRDETVIGPFRGSRKLVRTVSSDGRSARTRFRCIRPSMSRDPDRAFTLVRGIDILELLGLFEDTTHSQEGATQALRGPLRPGRMESQGQLRPEGAVRGTSVPHLQSRQGGSRLPGLLIGPAGSMKRLESANMVGNAGSSTTRAQGTLLRPLLREPVGQAYVFWVLVRLDVWQVHSPATQVLASEAASGDKAYHASYHCRPGY